MSFTDQDRIEIAADNCEVLRARLAKYEDAEGRPVSTVAELTKEIERIDAGAKKLAIYAVSLETELAMAKDAADKGDIARMSAGGMEQQIIELEQELAALKAQPSVVILSDEELWSIRNQVAIHEVLRDDDSVKICVKHGRAVEQAVLARLNTSPSIAVDTLGKCSECEDRIACEAGAIAMQSTLAAALKRLTFAARTSGGTAGPDEELMAACAQAEDALSMGSAGRAFMDAAGKATSFAQENDAFEEWRKLQMSVLSEEGAAAFYRLGSVQWSGWQARASLTASAPNHSEQVREWKLAADELPASGKPVLAYYLNSHGMKRRIRAMHVKRFTVEAEEFADTDTQCAEYSEQDDCYYTTEGWYELIDNWPDYSSCAVIEGVITHWQELPAAPSAAPAPGECVLVDESADKYYIATQALNRSTGQWETVRGDFYLAGTHPLPAWSDVIAERQRQISAEGWTPAHDDAHSDGALAKAAACYAAHADDISPSVPKTWPWMAKFWKPGATRRMLVKSGALILAEIERLDRAILAQQGKAVGDE